MTTEQIAAVCYNAEATRRGVNAFWDTASPEDKSETIAGVQFIIDNPHAGPPKEYRMAKAAREADGWEFGPTFDAEAKTDPSLVAFERADPGTQQGAHLRHHIVRTLLAHDDIGVAPEVEPSGVITHVAVGDTIPVSDDAALGG